MIIATLQFAPTLGAVDFNLSRANALLASLTHQHIDLLVLPELAFSGYNFPSLDAITPYLEPTASGPSTAWAKTTAKRLDCHVIVGYPERCAEDGRNYNATVTVSPAGEVLLNYRKSFLYYTDESWASEGPAGSCHQHKGNCTPFFTEQLGTLSSNNGNLTIGHGICMDINPYRFATPWTDYEFATAMLQNRAKLIILSTAWLTRLLPAELAVAPEQPDMETVAYWLERMFPLLTSEEEFVVVFANRCGTEGTVVGESKVGADGRMANISRGVGELHVENGEHVVEMGDRVCYAGSSCVMKFQNGGVRVFERGDGPSILGKGEEGVLVVDTKKAARYLLQSR